MGYDQHTLSPFLSHYLLHMRQSLHGSVETSLTVLQGCRKYPVQNVKVSMSILFLLRDVFDVLLIYKGVLPFGFVRDELLLHEPIHLTEIVALVVLLLLGKTICKVTYFG